MAGSSGNPFAFELKWVHEQDEAFWCKRAREFKAASICSDAGLKLCVAVASVKAVLQEDGSVPRDYKQRWRTLENEELRKLLDERGPRTWEKLKQVGVFILQYRDDMGRWATEFAFSVKPFSPRLVIHL